MEKNSVRVLVPAISMRLTKSGKWSRPRFHSPFRAPVRSDRHFFASKPGNWTCLVFTQFSPALLSSDEAPRNPGKTRAHAYPRSELVCPAGVRDDRGRALRGTDLADLESQVVRSLAKATSPVHKSPFLPHSKKIEKKKQHASQFKTRIRAWTKELSKSDSVASCGVSVFRKK